MLFSNRNLCLLLMSLYHFFLKYYSQEIPHFSLRESEGIVRGQREIHLNGFCTFYSILFNDSSIKLVNTHGFNRFQMFSISRLIDYLFDIECSLYLLKIRISCFSKVPQKYRCNILQS